jgi:hypothetical protein
VEALAVLVNERLARDGELGRVSLDDVQARWSTASTHWSTRCRSKAIT